jgi:hypothetical protein
MAAFLQTDVRGRKFTILPTEWKQLFTKKKEIHEWLGISLLLKKSLYGNRVANLALDETQSACFTSTEVGFERLPSDGSVNVKRSEQGVMIVLNAVDDQIHFATHPEHKE